MSITKISKQKIALGYVAWWLLWGLLDVYALVHTIGLSWKDACLDAANTNLILATAGYFIYNALNYYQPSPGKRFYLFIWSIAIAVLCVGLQNLITIHYPYWHDTTYLAFFSNSLVIRGLFFWLMITIIMIGCWIWFYMEEQWANEKRESDAINLAREAELSKLRQQLQPHFLFNSLNSISALAGTRPEEARKMIQQLSDFLRGTLKKDEQQLVPFVEELQHLELYLEIEKVRFGHRLKTEVIRDDATSKMTLPSLLLQPIVENAIKFGLYDTVGSITICITAKMEDNYLLIEVQNPFDRHLTPPKSGTGFGLNSIQRRLYLLYARNDLLSTRQSENIFTTLLKIPQNL